ncbi:MAG: cytochrome c biosis protein CcsA, partial [Verrucomicrobiota bacterium]
MRGVSRWYFLSIVGGFGFQIAWLAERGEVLRRCPLTSSFDVLVFIAWSMVLFYLVIGPVYRVSLLGLFTAPAAFILQTVALLMGVPALGEIRPATSG